MSGSLNNSGVICRIIKSYQNHPYVLKIKSKFGSDLNSSDFQQITPFEVKTRLKEIDIKKAIGVDTIPPKLIKIDADIIIKNKLVSYFDKLLSPFISAYRKKYSIQQVRIRLLEEWREKLDKNFIVGEVLMDLSKAFG